MKNSVSLSLPQSEMVRGYEVKRLPLGAYLSAMEALRTAPKAILEACFPGESVEQALDALRCIDARMLGELILRAMDVVPGEAIRLIEALTGVPQVALLGDPAIGLDGAVELMEAFWRLNGIENFTRAVRKLAASAGMAQRIRTATGSKG